MRADFLAVNVNGRLPIGRAEVEQHSAAGALKAPTIPKALFFGDVCHHSGKGGFSWKRHQNFPGEIGRLRRIFGRDCEIPEPI